MVKAATEAATAASGGTGDIIGKVVKVNAAAAKGGDATSVNGIASGIKGIVETAEKAAAAVSAVSGKQILKAIVDAAGKGEKKGVNDVKETLKIRLMLLLGVRMRIRMLLLLVRMR
ncbi:hypothetical protein CV671_05770 [Borreliella burgdorferi]|uniref:variable large family protein n=1 Tax=Borreliella burgdorferi TaxID=139 RepID=UPI000D47207C|nr:variable large family protein [Borreliella burgdorferi]PRR49135.1 hypothetical protein CV671_05770 [Borreliella burgdorferi]